MSIELCFDFEDDDKAAKTSKNPPELMFNGSPERRSLFVMDVW